MWRNKLRLTKQAVAGLASVKAFYIYKGPVTQLNDKRPYKDLLCPVIILYDFCFTLLEHTMVTPQH